MSQYLYHDLQVVGFVGLLGPRNCPQILDPVYAVAATGEVLVQPYDGGPRYLTGADVISAVAFEESVTRGDATSIERTVAHPGGCLLASVGAGPPVYMPRASAHTHLLGFAQAKRLAGDRHWRSDEREAALAEYELSAAVSQEAVDYARMLLCDVTQRRRERLLKWIRGQGHDPERLQHVVRTAIESPASSRRQEILAVADRALSPYTHTASALGAILVADENGPLSVQTGSVVEKGRLLLVTKQANPAQNGIYTATAPGTATTPFVLTRTAGATPHQGQEAGHVYEPMERSEGRSDVHE